MVMGKSDSVIEDEETFDPQFESENTSSDLAIQAVDLHKRYRSFHRTDIVLNGVNLNCETGKFYILYGTGKSGKTALVKSILNIESYSRGIIAIFNKNVVNLNYNGTIGYMPQQIALDGFLTAIETISYFALLQKIDRHECVKNFRALQYPLTISNYSTLVHNLNEDQKRVLSFYIAIMASPKLIVLDQPTAGCDPLYKNFFWEKLRSVVDNGGTTVFMTCSEEAVVKYADIVGYLRNGILVVQRFHFKMPDSPYKMYSQIVVEEPPVGLMNRYNIWTFNELIFSIAVAELKAFKIVDTPCAQAKDNVSIKSGGFTITRFTSNDDAESVTNERIIFDSSFNEHKSKKLCPEMNIKFVLNELAILIKWQARVALRKYLKHIFYLLLPALCILFYGYSVGGDIDVNLGIVHCGNNSCSNVETPVCAFERRISEKYLKKIPYDDYEKASQELKKGTLSALLLLNEDPNNLNTFDANQKLGCQANIFTKTNVVLELDASSKLVRSHIIDQLSRTYGGSIVSNDRPLIPFSLDAGENDKKCLSECPITPFISNFIYSGPAKYESEVAHLIWGAVATITHFTGALIGALPLCVQNRNGILDRMKMIGVTNFKLQVVHWITRALFIVLQNILILITTILFLGGEFSAYTFFTGWCVATLQSLCGFSFGILLFGVLRKSVPVILTIVVCELIVTSISGFLFNYHGLSLVFRKITIVLPHHSVSKLLTKVIIQNISLVHDYIWVGFASPLFWMISTYLIYCIFVDLTK